jgi:hypothetical protein
LRIIQTSEKLILPGVSVKLAALVYTKDKVNIFAGAECLIQNALIMLLSSPYALLDAKIQVVLERD